MTFTQQVFLVRTHANPCKEAPRVLKHDERIFLCYDKWPREHHPFLLDLPGPSRQENDVLGQRFFSRLTQVGFLQTLERLRKDPY
jgi:hypothetical protein